MEYGETVPAKHFPDRTSVLHDRRTSKTQACRLSRLLAVANVGLLLLASASTAEAQQDHKGWSDYGGGADNSHYLALNQITKSNVSKLKVAWTYPTHDDLPYVFNPIVVDGVMYVLARNNSLVAIDAASGKEKWIHGDLNGIAGRGINFWQSKDKSDKRLIFQIHQQLQEIDAKTGKSILAFGNDGFVDLRTGLRREPQDIYRIQSGTPGRIFENLIILGSSTGEAYLSAPGDLRAYDILTGKLVWQFHTVPHPGEYGYDTWPKDAWKYIGGTNTWGEFSLDDKRGIAYFPVGSPTYDYYGADRTGNNLFSDTVLALDARTGKYIWHFQEVHHDLWDYDPCSAPQLTTVQYHGKPLDVVAQAGKTGLLYVLDRETGKPLWPMEERPVPESTMPGEHASPTQPIPSVPPPFVRLTFTESEVDPYLLTKEEQDKVKAIIRASAKDQMFAPPTTHDTIEMPGSRGGSNWGMTAANPTDGMVYVSSIDAPAVLHLFADEPEELGFGVVRTGGPPGGIVYQKNCQMCHGGNREGAMGPSLVDITNRLGLDAIRSTVVNGKGQMPAFTTLSEQELNSLLAYLADPNSSGGSTFSMPFLRQTKPKSNDAPADLLVASGGAPAGKTAPGMKIPGIGPYGMMGGPPYPAGIDTPKIRYYSGWNVMYKYINPPWSTLVAYDLNQGTIKWKVPIGEEETAVRMGAKDTGAIEEQRGIIVTSTGLLFLASSDGKVRAYDDKTGKTLWTSQLPGGNKAIPAMYEVDGRQYLVINATVPLSGKTAEAGTGTDAAQRGYVVYALH
jgi:quinoprotein glucose dehydrogenase